MAMDDPELTVDAILAVLETVQGDDDPPPDEGLRERKKRRLRQRISNVATAMFLAEGFDNVGIARIAATCEVSEQTVFNYFPTKESMLFDRTESMTTAIAEAVRTSGQALSTTIRRALFGATPRDHWERIDEEQLLRLFRLFCEVATGSATLRAAPYHELGRFTATVGAALAERRGTDPDSPEVRLTAIVIAGLAHVRTQATFMHARTAQSMADVERAVSADVDRALRIAAPALDAFDRLAAPRSASKASA
jgi:AcrR family transcriptional regulator